MESPSSRRVATLLRHVLGGDDDAGALHRVPTAAAAVFQPTLPATDIPVLTRLLDHDNHEMRDAMKHFMNSDLYKPVRACYGPPAVFTAPTHAWRRTLTDASAGPQRYDMPLRVERELALERLSQVCGQRFFSVRQEAC